MRKLFLLLVLMVFTTFMWATPPTITIDGDKSDWAEVPMLTEPGTWPMLKVLPAADAVLGTNALAFMLENTADFASDWSKYPGSYIDKDYDIATNPAGSWVYSDMGIDYYATTGTDPGSGWIDFDKAISANNKVIEMGFPATWITDLGTKFAIGMYYGTGGSQEWFVPKRSGDDIDKKIGLLYKTRSFTTLPGTATAANAFAHNCIGECTSYVDFGLRDNGNDTARWAAFPIEITKAGKYDVTANVTSTNGWKFEFWVVDVATNAIVAHLDAPVSDVSSSVTSYSFGTLDLSAVPTGKYMLKVKNRTAFSKVKLNSIDLTYAGGAIVNVPATLLPEDAILSSLANIKAGAVDSILFTADGYYCDNATEWAKWKINVTKAGMYNFTANTYRKSGSMKFEIAVLNSDESSTLISNDNGGNSIGSSGNASISTGNVELAVGTYIVKVRDIYVCADSRLVNVVAEYKGGATVNVPATLLPEDATLSTLANIKPGAVDSILFTADGYYCDNATEWAKWKINVTKAGMYNFTANTYRKSGSMKFEIAVLNSDESSTLISNDNGGNSIGSSGNASISTGNVELAVGTYIVKVRDIYVCADSRLLNVIATYAGGAVINVPDNVLLAEEAVLESIEMYRESNGDIHYDDIDANPADEYAWWNVHATQAGNMTVALNFVLGNGSGHIYRVELYDGSTLKSYTEEAACSWDENITLDDPLNIPAVGDYTIRLINKQIHSSNIFHSITLTPAAAPTTVTLDEAATDNSAWVANVDGAAVNVELTRTFTGGMYNTICLPFAVESDAVETAFGAGVELMYMTGATLDGTVLDLEFASTTSIYQGTPYLIKPASNVVNPQFTGVEFTVSDATTAATGGTNADFIGTFVKTTILANVNNLYLQSGNVLMFSENDVTIKGTRAYFHVKVPSSSPVVRPRIVMNGQVLTDIELINGEPQTNGKFIENGQLIIIRDGVRYNALGVRVK